MGRAVVNGTGEALQVTEFKELRGREAAFPAEEFAARQAALRARMAEADLIVRRSAFAAACTRSAIS